MSLAMRPNELNTEINRLQGAMPSSLFYVQTVDADVSNLNEIKKNPIEYNKLRKKGTKKRDIVCRLW